MWDLNTLNNSVYLLCISISKCMLMHVFEWSKAIKNTQKSSKSTFVIVRTRGSCKAHLGKWRKIMLVSNLEWLPKAGWHSNARGLVDFFLVLIVFLRKPLVQMMKKVSWLSVFVVLDFNVKVLFLGARWEK